MQINMQLLLYPLQRIRFSNINSGPNTLMEKYGTIGAEVMRGLWPRALG